ncbi:MAG TPA: Fe-S cluster assembly protein SufD, partial [Burkholderiales bacterium]|nr:Fe-S cluster assembly protein SufD [Burkholderiales bacterium]
MNTETRSDYLESLLHGRDVVPEARAGWLKTLRAQAVERANALTVPTTRDEDWRFTDLSPLYKVPYRPSAQPGEVSAADLGRFEIAEATTRLTFVDGHFAPALSRIVPADGVLVANLPDALATHGRLVESRLGTLAATGQDAFAAVNTAFLHDGALIHVGRDHKGIAPIHLLFIATRNDGAAYPRVLVI